MIADVSDLLGFAAVATAVAAALFSGVWRGRLGGSGDERRGRRNGVVLLLAAFAIAGTDLLIGVAVVFAVVVEALGTIGGMRSGASRAAQRSLSDRLLARGAWGSTLLGSGLLLGATGAGRFSTLGSSLVEASNGSSPLVTTGLWLFIGGLTLGLLPHLGTSTRQLSTMSPDSLALAIGPVRVFALIGLFRVLRATVDLVWPVRVETLGTGLLVYAVVGALVAADIRRRVAFFGVAQCAILLHSLGDFGDADSADELAAFIHLGALHLGVTLPIAYAALGPLLIRDRAPRADSLKGRAAAAPMAALAFSVALLSLAALPPGGGFRVALDSSLRALDRGSPGLALLVAIGQGTLLCLGLGLVQGLYSTAQGRAESLDPLGQDGYRLPGRDRSPLLWLTALALLALISLIPSTLLAQ